MQVRIQSLFLTSALLLTEVRIFSGPYLEKEAKHLCFLVTLQTVNGVSTVGNVSTMLNHFITEQDFLTKKVRIFFYISCSVRSNRRWSRLDEKILNTAVYKVSNQQAVTGFLTATPAAISTISAYNTIESVLYN
jgi:hypothetical protein